MTEINKVKCQFPDCGHEWVPRVPNPQLCPKCKRRDWDKEVKDVAQTTQASTTQ